tara:strand:+ start:4532 stop:5590 length:1059 start_codon:yes stop_codon:yes gene_type:complete
MIAMTGIAWLTQSLRFIELIIIKGLPLNIFIYLTILIIPKLLATIIPFLAFLASLITYLRLNVESELIAIKTAGINNFKIIIPALIFGLFLGTISIIIENYISPYSLNNFKTLQNNIRDNYISIMFQEKVFSSPVSDLTVFIKEKDKIGNFGGIFIHDAREKNKIISMIAEKGKIEKTNNGAKFTLLNGNRQETKNENTSILYFEKYTLNINKDQKEIHVRFKEPSERKFSQLFNPEQNIDPLYKREFQAEAHKRIITPLIIIIMTLLGALTSIFGSFKRRTSIKKIFYSVIFAIILQIYIILTPQFIVSYSKIIPFIYLPPIITIILILFLTTLNTEKLKYRLLTKESLER